MFTLYGGVVADRVDKRRFVILLQSGMLLEALALGVLTHLGLITVQWVMGLAVVLRPPLRLRGARPGSRWSREIVDRDDLMNAIALSSSAFNLARVIGPAIAGALIATVGLAACFFANAASYLAVHRRAAADAGAPSRGAEPRRRRFGALKEGFGYVFGNPWPRALITIIATFSVFGFSFMPMMPVFARDALGLDADGYGALVSAIGLGAASGAIGMAATRRSDQARARW